MFRNIFNRHTSRTSFPFARKKSTLKSIPQNNRTRYYLLLGAGTTVSLCFIWGHTVHADGPANAGMNAASINWIRKHGLKRVDSVGITSNVPVEDSGGLASAEFSNTLNFYCFNVFDGHNGPWTASFLIQTLPHILLLQLADLYSKQALSSQSHPVDLSVSNVDLSDRNPGDPPDPVPTGEEIDETIKHVFRHVDDLVVHSTTQIAMGLDDAAYAALGGLNVKDLPGPLSLASIVNDKPPSFPEAVGMLNLPYSGACAVVGIFNSSDRSLRVAVTGDCRAVLGRRVVGRGNRYIYETHQLSVDQTPKNPSEVARLSALHPGESELFNKNRLLGWAPTRAFGDGMMKWSLDLQQRLQEDFLGDRPRDVCKTPPYFTAEPVITTTEGIRKGDFAVFASDGLWDCLSSEEVVGLVGLWLEKNGVEEQIDIPGVGKVKVLVPTDKAKSASPDDAAKSAISSMTVPSKLPVIFPSDYKDTTPMYKYWHREKKFVCKDANVAAHLAQNALGGGNLELTTALLSLPAPRSRKFRDDITISVAFFE
ncbi:hypothetical protein M413DRAFT_438957 [Hebeloma cylindrosporum]|uniref:PPM-type phosphatase domain-containing protein n=1 Tax=Hebeloma cylindrosporum TaxID=76867 RepID=A0A0C3D085_HEBCY|nr:hypothetical protein M413DRAFT_438957 [Hebeloma cylindrosporum h7]